MSLGRTKGGNPKVFFLFVAHVSYACCINQRRGTSPSLECHMKHLNHRVSGRLNRHIKVGSPEVSKTLNFFFTLERYAL